MKYLLLLTSMTISSVFAAENQSTLCTFGDKERKIEVVYPEAGGKACEVQYTKGSNMQILWSANSDLSYCEKRAIAFVEKQQGWGWECVNTTPEVEALAEAESLVETEPMIDTETEMAEEASEEVESMDQKN